MILHFRFSVLQYRREIISINSETKNEKKAFWNQGQTCGDYYGSCCPYRVIMHLPAYCAKIKMWNYKHKQRDKNE